MTKPFNPLMQFVLAEELTAHPEKDKGAEEKASVLGQELLETLWKQERKPDTFWEKVKTALSDDVGLPQTLFNRIVDFQTQQKLDKKEMNQVMFYATRSFRKGTEILARGCYLFHHNPQAFQKYATSEADFAEDIHQTTVNEENIFMPNLTINPVDATATEDKTDRLPLHCFAPVKYGFHPSFMTPAKEVEKHKGLFSEPFLDGFDTNPYRFEPLKKLLTGDLPESNYPAQHHIAVVIAVNAFNGYLNREPVKICAHKGNSVSPDKQNKR
ncbi:MAG: hypothetical protein IKQ99_00640 [Alphaproteobacteria bacterium]|nr:hypothetical protein [Alphaproteobacteria bacterium]